MIRWARLGAVPVSVAVLRALSASAEQAIDALGNPHTFFWPSEARRPDHGGTHASSGGPRHRFDARLPERPRRSRVEGDVCLLAVLDPRQRVREIDAQAAGGGRL